jgi:hypothetical protein
MLLFTGELQRRSDAHGWGLLSSATHPGYARTDVFANGPGGRSLLTRMSRLVGKIISQSAAEAALPALFAAASEDVRPGGFYGPGGLLELAGPAAQVRISSRALDETVAGKLWEVSEQLTGVKWAVD